MKNLEKGLTLIEMVVVLSLIGVMALISMPFFLEWSQNSRYQEVARDVAGALRMARSSAVSTNREHRVEFDVDGDRYRIVRGDRPYNSNATSWNDPANLVRDWTDFPDLAVMRRNASCDNDTDINIEFNPNGTSMAGYICIMESDNPTTRRYRVGIPSSATGRVIIER